MENNTVISAKGIVKRFGKKRVLHGIDLIIENNERVAIVGGNGAGKTTLLNILSQNDKKFVGKLKLNVKASEMSFQFQTLNYPNELTLLQLLKIFTVKRKGISTKEFIKSELESVDLFEHKDKYPSELSGGQLQKFNLLMTMATMPKLIFFDEILSGLDQPSIAALIEYVKTNIHNKATTITVSHNPAEIFELCDRVIFLKDGHVHLDYPISKFKDADDLEKLMKEIILDEEEIDYDSLMILEKTYKNIYDDDNFPLLNLNGIKKWYGLKDVLTGEEGKGIELNFHPGDSVGIVGRNGSGKSTLVEIIAGVKKPSKGKVDIDIFDVHSKNYHNLNQALHNYKYSSRGDKIQDRIDKIKVNSKNDSYTKSELKHLESLKKKREKKLSKYKKKIQKIVKKNIKDNRHPKSSIATIQFQKQFYPSMLTVRDVVVYNLQTAKIDYDEFYIDNLLESIGLFGSKNSTTHDLSGGQRQKLNIMLSIIKKPAILVLDELTTGLDLLAQEKLLKFIKEYIERENPITLVVTHSFKDIYELANKVLFINEGQVAKHFDFDFESEKDIKKTLDLLSSLDDAYSKKDKVEEAKKKKIKDLKNN